MLDDVIEAINAALDAGDWATVVTLTTQLYHLATLENEMQLVELVQDLHWIANDALVHPIEIQHLLAEVRS